MLVGPEKSMEPPPDFHQTLAEIAKAKNVGINKIIVAIFNNL